MSEADLVDLRRKRVAFVFQTFGLIPILTAAERLLRLALPRSLNRI
jgi:ABC-type proline/glycine betaine transport system ATPase subunit